MSNSPGGGRYSPGGRRYSPGKFGSFGWSKSPKGTFRRTSPGGRRHDTSKGRKPSKSPESYRKSSPARRGGPPRSGGPCVESFDDIDPLTHDNPEWAVIRTRTQQRYKLCSAFQSGNCTDSSCTLLNHSTPEKHKVDLKQAIARQWSRWWNEQEEEKK